jgi:hypothetical protein
MTFAELPLGTCYVNSPGYLVKQKIGAQTYLLIDHIDRLIMKEVNVHREVREVQCQPAWPPTIKQIQLHWSED